VHDNGCLRFHVKEIAAGSEFRESFRKMCLAYYIHDLSPFLIHFSGGIGIRWYGMAYLAGFVIGILLYRRLAVRGYSDLRPDQVADFITMAALFGVLLGGRLGYMLFYDTARFFHNPLVIVQVWDGGMASHGGILGLTLFTLWYAQNHRISFCNLTDNLVVVGPVGVFFGRCANFINGELYGRITDVSWAVQFPKEILFYPTDRLQAVLDRAGEINPSFSSPDAIIQGVASSPALRAYLATELAPRFPSQLLEAALEGVFLFLLLWILRTRVRLPDGALTGIFFIAYALVRIGGECFREPDAPTTAGLTRGQFLSLFMIAVGFAFLLWSWLRPRYPRAWKP
jgi:phosphatidylglycerol:prolipoprotein diacylglycerol transferase